MGGVCRRAFLETMGAGMGAVLLDCQFAHAVTGTAGRVNLSLTALTGGLLRISLSPVKDPIRPDELGVVAQASAATLLPPGLAQARMIAWGRYALEILENPLRARRVTLKDQAVTIAL